jgi:hypothetical protein
LTTGTCNFKQRKQEAWLGRWCYRWRSSSGRGHRWRGHWRRLKAACGKQHGHAVWYEYDMAAWLEDAGAQARAVGRRSTMADKKDGNQRRGSPRSHVRARSGRRNIGGGALSVRFWWPWISNVLALMTMLFIRWHAIYHVTTWCNMQIGIWMSYADSTHFSDKIHIEHSLFRVTVWKIWIMKYSNTCRNF